MCFCLVWPDSFDSEILNVNRILASELWYVYIWHIFFIAANRSSKQIWVFVEANRIVCSLYSACCTKDSNFSLENETRTTTNKKGWKTKSAISWRVSIIYYAGYQWRGVIPLFADKWNPKLVICRNAFVCTCVNDIVWIVLNHYINNQRQSP